MSSQVTGSYIFREVRGLSQSEKDTVFSGWAAAKRDILGLDDGTPEYQEKIMAELGGILCAPYADYNNLNRLLNWHLSRTLQAQPTLAWAIEEEVERCRQANDHSNYFSAEALLKIRERDPDSIFAAFFDGHQSAESLIDFLMSDGERTDEFRELGEDFSWFFYREFWDLNRDQQAEFFQALFDAAPSTLSPQSLDLIANKIVTDRFLPRRDKSLPPEKDSYFIGLDIANAASEKLPFDMKVDALVGLIHAEHAVAIGAIPDNFGYKLYEFLVKGYGSFGAKVTQFIDGMSTLKPEWKAGFSPSKNDADPPTHPVFLRWVKNAMAETWHAIKWFKGFEGMGSMRGCMHIELDDAFIKKQPDGQLFLDNNWDTVVSVLRPGAKEKVSKYADAFVAVIRYVINESTFRGKEAAEKAAKSTKPILGIMLQAQQRMKYETDQNLTAKQEEVMRRHTDGLKIKVGNREYSYYTARTLATGEDFTLCRRVEGQSFNAAYQELLAKAETMSHNELEAAAKELKEDALGFSGFVVLSSLRGESFDTDVHGRNGKRKENQIGLFDYGAVPLNFGNSAQTQPSLEQLRAVPDIIKASAENFLENSWNETTKRFKFSLGSSLRHKVGDANAMASTPADGQRLMYMNMIEQTVPSLGDYFRCMRGPDYAHLLAMLLSSGEIHKEIAPAFTNTRLLKSVVQTVMHQTVGKTAHTKNEKPAEAVYIMKGYHPQVQMTATGWQTKNNSTLLKAAGFAIGRFI